MKSKTQKREEGEERNAVWRALSTYDQLMSLYQRGFTSNHRQVKKLQAKLDAGRK